MSTIRPGRQRSLSQRPLSARCSSLRLAQFARALSISRSSSRDSGTGSGVGGAVVGAVTHVEMSMAHSQARMNPMIGIAISAHTERDISMCPNKYVVLTGLAFAGPRCPVAHWRMSWRLSHRTCKGSTYIHTSRERQVSRLYPRAWVRAHLW